MAGTGGGAGAGGLGPLIEALRASEELVNDPERGGRDTAERAAGLLYMTELTRLALDLYADQDGAQPRFIPFSSPIRNHTGELPLQRIQGGANPDGFYDFAVLDPTRAYRISGKRGNDCYLSMSFSGGQPGEWPIRTVATLNDRQMQFESDGSFEVTISTDERQGNWVRMEPDVCSLIVRQYFDVEPTERRPAFLNIEVVDDRGPENPAPAEHADARLAAAAAFIRSTNEHFPLPGGLSANSFTEPLGYTGEAGALGTTDNVYCMGRWELEDGEELIIETTPTRCGYWSVQLWNHWGQSLVPVVDTQTYATQIVNVVSAKLRPDGSVRVVVAAEDPGEPNWLSTHGWRRGAMIFRFLYPEERPLRPEARVERQTGA